MEAGEGRRWKNWKQLLTEKMGPLDRRTLSHRYLREFHSSVRHRDLIPFTPSIYTYISWPDGAIGPWKHSCFRSNVEEEVETTKKLEGKFKMTTYNWFSKLEVDFVKALNRYVRTIIKHIKYFCDMVFWFSFELSLYLCFYVGRLMKLLLS